ncbi:MAG: hypothetical protein HC888_01040 [Candidatus Competibacteraceae bacterium]|nr:hypothetical protein [Candidatus Competibacteraceae bacterium]
MNIHGFDIFAIGKVYGEEWVDILLPKAVDTMVTAMLTFPEDVLRDRDARGSWPGKMIPPQLFGSHTLKAWGYRMGMHKGEFGDTSDWAAWSPEMQAYCARDVSVNVELSKRLQKFIMTQQSFEIEQQVSRIIARQVHHGVRANRDAILALYTLAQKRLKELTTELVGAFGSWYKPGGEFTPKVSNKKSGYTRDATLCKVKHHTFSPGSRQDIAYALKRKYGWKPKVFTPTGQPQIDESTLGPLPYPEAKLLLEYLDMQKLSGQVYTGDNSWMRYITPEGRIHGRVITNKAVTGRASHSSPNLGQVRSADSHLGPESRECFEADEAWVMVGSDQQGVELRALAHHLYEFDGGAYADELLKGDVHLLKAHLVTEIPKEEIPKGLRNGGKTAWTYSWLYGAGDKKLAVQYAELRKQFPQMPKLAGKDIRYRMEQGITGVEPLLEMVKDSHNRHRYIIGMDGRKVYTRSEHSALNTLLQHTGAMLAKMWIIKAHELIASETNWKWGKDYAQVLWVHDELQFTCRPEIADQLGDILLRACLLAGEAFGCHLPIEAEYKVGKTWRDTH